MARTLTINTHIKQKRLTLSEDWSKLTQAQCSRQMADPGASLSCPGIKLYYKRAKYPLPHATQRVPIIRGVSFSNSVAMLPPDRA